MKLAEALSIRAELQTKIAELKERIKASAKVLEGDFALGIRVSGTGEWL